jgi:hypothetical protein
MNIFSLSLEDEEELEWKKALQHLSVLIPGWFHWRSLVYPLVHWMELQSFLYTTKYFKYLTGFRLWRQYWRQLLGSLFKRGVSPSKMGHIAPFLATIQRLSKTRAFLPQKRSEGCFVWAAPSLSLARPYLLNNCPKHVVCHLGIESGSGKS